VNNIGFGPQAGEGVSVRAWNGYYIA
jgi:hypothetical protein